MAPPNRRGIPVTVLTRAKKLAQAVADGPPAESRRAPPPPSPPREARAPLDRAKREKLVAALKRLHPMD